MDRVGVVLGGPSPEHDISILTGLQACRALRDAGHGVTAIYWAKNGSYHAVDSSLEASAFAGGTPPKAMPLVLRLGEDGGFHSIGSSMFTKAKALEVDIVVNCCHGGPGEDGSLQGSLDLAGVAYTGPTARSAALGMDKYAFAGAVSASGLSCLPRVLLNTDLSELPFEGPYIVKPRYGGSSIGIDVVEDLATAKMRLKANVHLKAGAVVEPYRPNLFDLQLAAKSWPELSFSPLEKPLRNVGSKDILSYRDKYMTGEGMATAPRELPAKVDEKMRETVLAYAKVVCEIIDLRGVARVDFLASDEGELYVNEVNTIPGSLSHYLWIEPKLSFAEQLLGYLEEARSRPSSLPISAGADGTVLRSAASVAAKLA